MKKILSVICVSLLILVMIVPLVACTPRDQVVRILSQSEYIDEDLLDDFEDLYGIEVRYEFALTNEEIYQNIDFSEQDFDLICVSDYMLEKMAREGLLQELDFDNIPNADNREGGSNISPYIYDLLSGYDASLAEKGKLPLENYAVGYMWGTMGIVYNTEKTGIESDLDSLGWGIFWDAKYNGQALLKDSVRDSYFAAAMSLGLSNPNASDSTTRTQVGNRLKSARDNNGALYLTVDKDREYMIDPDKNKAVSLQWAGDAIYTMELAADEGNGGMLNYYLPDQNNLFIDGYAVPKFAQNKYWAEKFIDFLCDPETAIANMDFIGYTSCVAHPDLIDYFWESEYYDYILNDGGERDLIDVSYFFTGANFEGYDDYDLENAALLWIQYPPFEKLEGGIMMRDFKDNYDAVATMWSNFMHG